jgi:hypothetical protein
MDIKGFFDNLDHDLVLEAVAHHTDQRWILLYVQLGGDQQERCCHGLRASLADVLGKGTGAARSTRSR